MSSLCVACLHCVWVWCMASLCVVHGITVFGVCLHCVSLSRHFCRHAVRYRVDSYGLSVLYSHILNALDDLSFKTKAGKLSLSGFLFFSLVNLTERLEPRALPAHVRAGRL